ncbi:MAG: ABC transporter substrate-binding protein [Bacilli bacterium]
MKKKLIVFLCLIIVVTGCILWLLNNNNNTDNKEIKKINVAEVAHTIFYAPAYAAINKGYFEDEGIEINLILTPGADKVTAAVLSGDVEIGFCGSEASIYVYNSGEKDYIINFARLTKRDGAFLVSREKYDNFTLNNLKGKKIIGGRAGGMPEMTFEWALRQNGIDPKKDVSIDTSIAFPAMEGAFIGGNGDFVTLFEPNALHVEKQKLGYVVGYVGTWGGEVPYTAYNAKKSYIENNPDLIKGFTRAVDKGLKYVKKTNSEQIAKDIYKFFPDLSINDLTAIIERYKTNDAWANNTKISKQDFDHLQEIIINAGELNAKAPYEKLIYQGK